MLQTESMEKDKSPIPPHSGGGLPPPSSSTASRYSLFGGAAEASEPEPQRGGGGGGNESNRRFSQDISGMPDLPPKNLGGHRRAHSEILSLPDDISFDSDLGVVGGSAADGPSFSDETDEDLFSMYFDLDKFNTATSPSSTAALQFSQPENFAPSASGSGERPRFRHQHSQSMDGSTSIKQELLMSGSDGGGSSLVETKKAISAAKLADLALVDPKRAKRIWANRQSAARSKERKIRYISELERKVQTLQTDATTLSAQLTMLQRDTNGLTSENNELKLRLSTVEQQVHLQDALNDALRDEVQRLKLMTGQNIGGGGPTMNFGSTYGAGQQFYPDNHAMHTLLAAHQFQQLQINHSLQQSQQQQQQFQHPAGDLRHKSPGPSSNQRDSASDTDPTSNSR